MAAIMTGLGLAAAAPGCATVKSALAIKDGQPASPPIQNPFGAYYAAGAPKENIVLRTKKGDRAVEVELPGSAGEMTDFMIPISPAFEEQGRRPASASGAEGALVDERYRERGPGITDREITSRLPRNLPEDEGKRREVETGLGLIQAEDPTPQSDKSYLAQIDHVKQLYKVARYEAALMELDEMVRQYPTDAKLYEMRGTLLDRVGRTEMALQSWQQALRFDPGNVSLKKFVERKQLTYQRRPAAAVAQ
jgi:tetratricopeptide (TPR) repeat protein